MRGIMFWRIKRMSDGEDSNEGNFQKARLSDLEISLSAPVFWLWLMNAALVGLVAGIIIVLILLRYRYGL